MLTLEEKFDQAMEELYYRTGREIGYWANYFIRSVRQKGGLVTAKRMLGINHRGKPQKGLQKLIDAGRVDLCLEILVLKNRFRSLFTNGELTEAQQRINSIPKYAKRKALPPEEVHPETLSEKLTYMEGSVKFVLVSTYERDPKARVACLLEYGFRCSVCEMNFEDRYGNIGKDFIHVHHKNPLAACRGNYQLDPIKDLVPVCPNCHSMLHTSDPPLSVMELKEAMAKAARE